MLQLVLAMGGQGQIGWAATSMLPPAALGLAGASWRTANGKKLTTAWRSKQHCRYSVSPIKTFVQREALRENIREQLSRELDDDRKGGIKKVGIHGLGGAGKSQLALSYLRRYRVEYDATFWIQAGQPASIDRDFLEIYRSLPGSSHPQLSQ